MDQQISKGDRITFRAATRWSHATATRIVNGFYNGWPTVRYGGCPNFIVKHHEISAVAPVNAHWLASNVEAG